MSALLLALSGLFAMHGLGDHGTSVHADAAAVSMAMDHADHADHATSPSVDVSGTGRSGHGMDMGAAGMCLAVLLLVALAALVVALGGRGRPSWRRSSHPAPLPRARGRAPDPPDLFGLSVQRC